MDCTVAPIKIIAENHGDIILNHNNILFDILLE